MRTLIMLWLCVITIQSTFAQTTQNIIRPIDLVQSRKQNLETKTPKILFKKGEHSERLNIETYEIFEIDKEKAEAIQFEAEAELLLELPGKDNETLVLQLVKVEMPEFTVIESASQSPIAVDHAIHYRGVIEGDEHSIAAVSFIEGEMVGMVSSDQMDGNWTLAKLPEDNNRSRNDLYTFYKDKDIFQNQTFSCSTPDSGLAYDNAELRPTASAGRDLNDCVKVYLEVNYDIYQDKGSVQGAVQYITSLFNQVSTLYANEQINMSISEIMIWNTPSPYNTTSSGQMLTNFQSTRTSFNGDLAQLVSYQASGGIAVVDGLCHPYTLAKMSYAGISSAFQQVPTYSWSVMVMTHELGHLLGSQHTHACVWNGNGTALDACPGYTEGGCSNPALPTNGGTIMSYCHLSQVGINFSQGFGTQPGNLIRARVGAATCLSSCTTSGSGNGDPDGGNVVSCDEESVILRLNLDTYSPETTWSLKTSNGVVIAEGGPYPKTLANQLVLDTFCLSQACYEFEIMDAYNDGICCDYGDGSYTLVDAQSNILSQGGLFTNSEKSNFCLPFSTGGNDDDCHRINFAAEQVVSYGVVQDDGQYSVQDDGQTLYLANNAWKAILMEYEITPNTQISFDFKSTREGEIHGIGFDNNDNISYAYTFRVFGTQAWGLGNYDDYSLINSWKNYTIPVGEFYVGAIDRLFFCTDQDGGTRDGNSFYRNVRIFENNDCGVQLQPETDELREPLLGLKVFPNPTTNGQIELQIDQTSNGTGLWEVMTLSGQVIRGETVSTSGYSYQETINVDDLPRGTYLLRWQDSKGTQSTRFTVQ